MLKKQGLRNIFSTIKILDERHVPREVWIQKSFPAHLCDFISPKLRFMDILVPRHMRQKVCWL